MAICNVCRENPVECPSTGTCKNCYSAILRWSKRKSAEAQDRAHKLSIYSARMQLILPTNIELIRPKKVKIKAMPGTVKLKPIPEKKKSNGS